MTTIIIIFKISFTHPTNIQTSYSLPTTTLTFTYVLRHSPYYIITSFLNPTHYKIILYPLHTPKPFLLFHISTTFSTHTMYNNPTVIMSHIFVTHTTPFQSSKPPNHNPLPHIFYTHHSISISLHPQQQTPIVNIQSATFILHTIPWITCFTASFPHLSFPLIYLHFTYPSLFLLPLTAHTLVICQLTSVC